MMERKEALHYLKLLRETAVFQPEVRDALGFAIRSLMIDKQLEEHKKRVLEGKK